MQDADARMLRAFAATLPEGSDERKVWMRAAWRIEFAPDLPPP
jgi:hypothetical protein